MTRGRRVLVRALLLVGVVALAAACMPAPTKDSPNANPDDPGNPYGWFEAGLEWWGDFGDPQIVRVDDTYYAYSSPTGGRYLPVLTSTDLVHWYAHPRWSRAKPPWEGGPDPSTDPDIPIEIRQTTLSAGDKWNLNDGMVKLASWAQTEHDDPWIRKTNWAPGIIQIGSTWYAYSAQRISWQSDDINGFGRFCLSVASAPGPLGPFRDISGSNPIICDVDPGGSIDPSPFYDAATNSYYLLWKAAGRRTQPGVTGYPSSLKARRLSSNGFPDPNAPTVTLLSTNEGGWEGYTIEAPSMVTWGGLTYLFYAGNSVISNEWGGTNYATGYAICSNGPRAACQRVTVDAPLLASGDPQQGPAGGSAFVDGAGGLRFAYSYYWWGEQRPIGNPHPRRLAIVGLRQGKFGTLYVQ